MVVTRLWLPRERVMYTCLLPALMSRLSQPISILLQLKLNKYLVAFAGSSSFVSSAQVHRLAL